MYVVAHTAWILIDLDGSGFWVLKQKNIGFFGGEGFSACCCFGFLLLT